MKNIKLLILFLGFLPLVGAAQTADFTTVSTPAFCVNDGSIIVTATNTVGKVQYELVNYVATRSAIGVPQDSPVFLNLAPGTYMVGVYDVNNATIPITKEVIVADNGSGKTLTINSIYSNQLAYCATNTNPGSVLRVAPDGGAVPYIITVLDTNDVMVREQTSYGSYDFQGMPAGTYKIRVKDNCGTVVNSNSPHVIKPNIVYNFNVTTPSYWYWDYNVKVTHSGAGTICDPVTDAYYDFSYSGGIPVITGNDAFPISQVPGMTRTYAVEYDGVKTPYMTYNELIAYKQPLPLDINTWKPMTLWVSICGIEKSTIYDFPYRKNEFLPKLIANAGLTFYLADDKASTLCTPTGFVTLSRLSLLSGFCDPLTLTITEKNGAVPPQQYTITGANQNDFEAQLAIGNTYTFKLTDVNGSELNRLSYVNVTRGQRINMNSRDEVFIDPVSFRYYNQDELPFELASMADFKNFGKSQLGIKLDYYMPMPYTVAVTGPNGFYLEKTVSTMSYSGTLISDNLEVGDYSVRVTSATGCYDRTFTTTLDRVIDSISVTSIITPDPIACDRYIKTFNYKISNQGLLRPYPSTSFESMFNVPQIGFKVIDGPAGYTQTNAIINNTYSWGMSFLPTATAAFRGDITGLYKISLVDYYTPANVYGGPWEVDVKSEFPVFDMNGSGGAICIGSTTGTLSVVVKNATAPVYYLKKATDIDYPAVGQSSSDFPNLTAGDYMVKVETACYPTALETSFKMDYISNLGDVIVGTNVLCDTDALNLSVKSIGPVTSVQWKLPDGTTQTSNSLVLDNPQSGEYSVNITTRSGCIVTDTVEVKINRRATAAYITGLNQTICEGMGADMLVLSSVANPVFTWYSDAALTNVIATGENYGVTPVVTTTYYVTVQGDGVCENAPNTAKEIVMTVNPAPPNPSGDATQEFCLDQNATIASLVTNESNVIWYDAATGGNVISTGTVLTNGTIYYGSLTIGICESPTRFAVTVTVTPKAIAADITAMNLQVCPGEYGMFTASSTTVINPIFRWYKYTFPNMYTLLNTGDTFIPPTLGTVGSYDFYYISVSGDNKCENSMDTAQMKGVVRNTGKYTLASDIIVSDVVICYGESANLIITAPTITGSSSRIRIYSDSALTNLIHEGSGWNTGTLFFTGSLTATTTYYVSAFSNTDCENTPGTAKEVTVTVNNPQTPTGDATQEFCLDQNATIASLVTNENNVIWYDAPSGGNIISPITALTNGSVYYGGLGTGTCESISRLAVTAVINDIRTPTGAATQEFCLGENATIANLVTNETNIIWYDAANGGNIISDGTALVNGSIYYGSLTVGACESNTRLAVTAVINEVRTPTGNASQEFCLDENATVAHLVTNESDVIWYDAAIAGNIISTKRALTNGTIYYGSLRVGACENLVRLAVTAVIKTDLPGETVGWKATVCVADEVTYRTTVAMSDYNWIVTEGIIKAGGQLNDDFVTVTWTTAGNGSVGVAFINVSNCNPIVTIHFPVAITTCSDIAIGKEVNNPTPTIGENVIFTVTATNIGTSDFQNVVIDEMLPSGYSYVIATTTSGNYNSTNGVWNVPVLAAGTIERLTLTAKVLATGDYLNIASLSASTPTDPNPDNNRAEATVVPVGIVIYNAVSANGDGLNDYFKIEGLQHYPDNTVEIYNRWGVKIYEANGYGLNNNVFRGISDGRATVKKGEVVPAGTYFYILRYKTNTESRIEKSGYLYVN